ncbi:MAG: hypothetical protein A6F71_10030 [Cycloclasticus sp. symbiont of Poecilosclerida sp. M]|nr:MAG: hypothetical protein A6F71_10030 [Cycloclasticus sp. symbiont of Poecilosclerida sp. M]
MSEYYGGDYEEPVCTDADEQAVVVDELPDFLTLREQQELRSMLDIDTSEDSFLRNYLIAKSYMKR